MTPEDMAQLFHESYVKRASVVGYKVSEESTEFDPNSIQGKLMIEASKEVLKRIRGD